MEMPVRPQRMKPHDLFQKEGNITTERVLAFKLNAIFLVLFNLKILVAATSGDDPYVE